MSPSVRCDRKQSSEATQEQTYACIKLGVANSLCAQVQKAGIPKGYCWEAASSRRGAEPFPSDDKLEHSCCILEAPPAPGTWQRLREAVSGGVRGHPGKLWRSEVHRVTPTYIPQPAKGHEQTFLLPLHACPPARSPTLGHGSQ